MTDQRLCLYMREGRRRSGIVCSAQYGDKDELRNQKKALEALLRLSKEAGVESPFEHMGEPINAWRIENRPIPSLKAI